MEIRVWNRVRTVASSCTLYTVLVHAGHLAPPPKNANFPPAGFAPDDDDAAAPPPVAEEEEEVVADR